MDVQQRQTIGRGRGRSYRLTAAIGLGMVAVALALQAVPVAAASWTTAANTCISGNGAATYTVPAGTRYVQVVAIGGTGFGGATATDNNTGGRGGTGAKVTAYLPVTPYDELKVGVGRNGNQNTGYSGRPNGAQSKVGAGQGGGSSVVTTAAGDPCLGCVHTQDATYTDFNVCYSSTYDAERARADTAATRAELLVVAGGGGGGGGGNTSGSGGKGGDAGLYQNFSGEPGSPAWGETCGRGGGGAGGLATSAGAGGAAGCLSYTGHDGSGFYGGMSTNSGTNPGLGGGGNGGGGYYGGGGGGSGFSLGGGGGGAGSSHVGSSVRFASTVQDWSATPSVTITPVSLPTTAATLSGTTSGNDWYTSALTVTLTATAGTNTLGKTYYALNSSTCSAANLPACQVYSTPLTFSSGAHTLTYFTVDSVGLDEALQTRSFAVTVTTAAVSGANISSGANPTAATTTTGSEGTVTVSGTGTGVVGAAVYGSNPAGAPVFNSSGAYVDVIVAGTGLTSLTITDCNLNGGINVYWWNGTAWALASNQTYNDTTKCVTITVNSTTVPTISQLTGTVIAAGSPPTTTVTATTADGKAYTAGVWTNQSVTVTFTCSANATATAPVTRASDGANQSADGTCTDGIGQKTPTTFTPINVDKTPPTCPTSVSPTVLWSTNSKPVAITGTTTARDNLSGVASVVGGAVTSNEALAAGDVTGFVINTAFAAPLRLSAVVNIAGQLKATRTPSGSGRTYAQTVTVTDQAGNTNTTPCTWTVTVPRDQGPAR